VAIWNRLTAFVTGGAVATAAADALAPELEPLKQTAWRNAPYRVVGPHEAAAANLKQIATEVNLKDDAARGGIGTHRFDLLKELQREFPGASELLELWRRVNPDTGKPLIDQEQFTEALRRQGVRDDFIGALSHLKHAVLDPAQAAAAIHRGLIPDPGLLKGEQPSGKRNVESYPVYPIDALATAEAHGYDRDELGVLVGLQGLPMGPHEAAQALFRNIITKGDYIAAFNESNSRNEWAEAILEQTRQIPTARDFFENALRGYHDFEWALNQAKRHGMSEADATVIYQNQGRPMNIRQITQALSRGGKFKPEPGELKDPYMASIVEGNIKPAYYDLALSLKYTLPSPFVMRQLTASGVWSEAKAAQRLKDSGWLPEDADEAAKAWATGTGTIADPHIAKAQVQLWTATHRSYIAGESDAAKAQDALLIGGVDGGSIDQILALWDAEKSLIRQQLTAVQVKKAYSGAVMNEDTGQPWTLNDAMAALLERGYNHSDASTYLAE
jgi:hypothetical protein